MRSRTIPIASRLVMLLCAVALLAPGNASYPAAASSAAQPVHGLKGHYYTDSNPDNPEGGYSLDEYRIPTPLKQPDAVRVDAQIAFGKDRGFQKGEVWWTPEAAKVVIWKGYIRLPKAGAYYFPTVSDDASAVYLNQARVTLNGNFGGFIPSEAFAHVAPGKDVANSHQTSYIVPVSVEGQRDLPIEVRYSNISSGRLGAGIDLYWVTPDSPKDANGEPLAQLVPTDALYVDPPGSGPTDKPTVSVASSTISSDFLYLPSDGKHSATLTVRLADANGQGIAGKKVHVSVLSDYAPSDKIVQPDKPTDEHGITTAKVTSQHTGEFTFFATDVTDLVDAAQVAHLTFEKEGTFFLPDTYAPYYDDKTFVVTPDPMVAGQPATIKTPLLNRSNVAAELTATFYGTTRTIGGKKWEELGKVTSITLQPGESKEVSITWTPKEDVHLCLRIVITGHFLKTAADGDAQKGMSSARSNLVNSVLTQGDPPDPGTDPPEISEKRERNVGPAIPCSLKANLRAGRFPPKICSVVPNRDPGQYESIKDWAFANAYYWRSRSDNVEWNMANPEPRWMTHPYPEWKIQRDWRVHGDAHRRTEAAYRKLADDPPDPDYRHLAIADSNTPDGYIDAVRVSLERYQGAQVEGDQEWMAKHFTAGGLYLKQVAEALRREADVLQKEADGLPPDDPAALAQVQAAQEEFFGRMRRGEGFTNEESQSMKEAGISEEETKALIARLLTYPELPPVSERLLLLDVVTGYRQAAKEAEQIAAAPVSEGEAGKPGTPQLNTYIVGNPHDKTETIDLFIRPVSLPPDWKLSIAQAAEETVGLGPTPTPDKSMPVVQEVAPGKHYRVRLPAGAEIKVASIVVSVGEVGANTTARWAVEGKIGDELIGGMMHEMSVPYVIPDLQLPPVGSAQETATGQPLQTNWLMYGGVAAASLVILGAVFFVLIRRRSKVTGS